MTSPGREEIRFNALRNALYHTARRRTLDRWNRAANFCTILLGTAVAAQVCTQFSMPEWIPGLAVAVVGALQLVLDFGGRARTHELLQSRYYELLASIEENPDPDVATIAGWAGVLTRIYGAEPPTLPVPDALAFNAAASALGVPEDELLAIPGWALWLSWILSLEGLRFRTIAEHRAVREAAALSGKGPKQTS